jgi:class 3 adenylate cyclase
MNATRRLAAILSADVVGYSRLMGEDEAGTAKIVRERRDTATPIVRSFGGRLVKTMGDGVLLEFPSVVAAVECAIAIQKMMAERNAPFPRPSASSIASASISGTSSSMARTFSATASTSPRG